MQTRGFLLRSQSKPVAGRSVTSAQAPSTCSNVSPDIVRWSLTAVRVGSRFYTCYPWPMRPAELAALATYADVLLGIHRGEVVAAYDNLTWRPEEDAERRHEVRLGLPRGWPRYVFDGTKSSTWAHLIGAPRRALRRRRVSGQSGMSTPALRQLALKP
jgi:hypothetical protein